MERVGTDGAAPDIRICQHRTAVKRIFPNRGHTVANVHGGQCLTSEECIRSNRCHAIAQLHGGKVRAITECAVANLAFSDFDGFKRSGCIRVSRRKIGVQRRVVTNDQGRQRWAVV